MRNNVPGGEAVSAFSPPGVAGAGGVRDEGPIERLRTKIKALEQVPVSLAFPPAPGSGPSRPACSFFSPDLTSSSSPGSTRRSSTPQRFDNENWGLLDARFRGHDKTCPLPPCGGAREDKVRAEGGESQSRHLSPTPLPTLPHKGGGKEQPGIRNPLSRLEAAGLHEIKPQAYADEAAAVAFTLAFLGARSARRKGASPLLWCLTEGMAREWGAPYGPGLFATGLDPAELLIVLTRTPIEAAWALEEGLKARAFIAAIGQFEIRTPLVARRLGLAAQASRTPCLLLSGHRGFGLPGTLTRWRIAASRSRPAPFDTSSPGAPTWRLTLERCRELAPAQSWIVEFCNDAYGVRLDAALPDREAEAGEERRMGSG